MTWEIGPIVRMQNWPLVRTAVSRYVAEEDNLVLFEIVGTDPAEVQATAEKVRARLEESHRGNHE